MYEVLYKVKEAEGTLESMKDEDRSTQKKCNYRSYSGLYINTLCFLRPSKGKQYVACHRPIRRV